MKSIEIGKFIYSLLCTDSRLATLVGNKIFPLIVENETTYPFIVYKRSDMKSNYTKDIHLSDDVYIDIICASENYLSGLEIAGIIIELLEDKRFKDKGIEKIQSEYANEDYLENAFIQNLGFKITITKTN